MTRRDYRLTTLFLLWLLAGAMAGGVSARNGYCTDLLKVLADKTGLGERLDSLAEGEHLNWALVRSQPVTVCVEHGRVAHLGYSIFSAGQRAGLGSDVCNFLERYCLELSLLTSADGFTPVQRMAEDRVVSNTGTLDAARLRKLCADTTVCISLQTVSGQGYTLGWRRDDMWIQRVDFPVEYDLIVGTSMDERERRLPQELMRHTVITQADTLPHPSALVKAWQDNYYTLKAGSYLLDNLTANQYFEKVQGGLAPIYNKVYPVESLANLLTTTLVDNDFTLSIRLRKYGFKTDTLSVPLKTWTDYCLKTGCKPYFGLVSLTEEVAVCELLMHNSRLGYNHVVRLTFPMRSFESRRGVIEARLLSYVNASRIKNLFDDYNPTKK